VWSSAEERCLFKITRRLELRFWPTRKRVNLHKATSSHKSVHAKISIGMHREVKFKISRIPLIGLETRLGWRTDRKFLRNPNLNEISVRVVVVKIPILLVIIQPKSRLSTKVLLGFQGAIPLSMDVITK
jgi:ABC-type xylose transport system permease subunit